MPAELLVALAGGVGAVLRFLADRIVARRTPHVGIPLGTIVINVTGSFLLGLIGAWWGRHGGDPVVRAALGVGLMGGFTTFSTASVEGARLASAREGWRLLIHTGGMLAAGLLAAGLGLWLGGL